MAKLLLLYHLIGSYEKEDVEEKLLQLRASTSWALTGLLTSQKVITVGRSTRCRAEKVHCNIYRIILWPYGCIAYYAPDILVLEKRPINPGNMLRDSTGCLWLGLMFAIGEKSRTLVSNSWRATLSGQQSCLLYFISIRIREDLESKHPVTG